MSCRSMKFQSLCMSPAFIETAAEEKILECSCPVSYIYATKISLGLAQYILHDDDDDDDGWHYKVKLVRSNILPPHAHT